MQTYLFRAATGWDKALDPAFDSKQTLLLVFGVMDKGIIDSALKDLKQAFPQSVSIGCSTAGEIYEDEIWDDSLSVAVVQFEKTHLKLAHVAVAKTEDSENVGEQLAQQLKKDDLKSVFVLSDGLNVNGSSLIKGMSNNLSKDVIITGGLAADGDRFSQTWLLSEHKKLTQCVVAIGFYGDHFCVAHGSRGGWDVMGHEREVTRSKFNVLYELDGQPALSLYKKYLGDRAKDLPASGLLFPLAIKNNDEHDGYTVRTILAVDEEAQSITFAGELPQGSLVSLMHANFDRLIDGASAAAENIEMDVQCDQPHLSIAISCVGRRLVLGQRTEEEVEATIETFNKGTKQIGFYSYGEISPLASGSCDLHNQTMTITLIGEK